MSHPMLQPSDWTAPPEAMVGEWPADRVAVYSLVWTMAEACAFEPPRLIHQRLVGEVNGQPIAVATVRAAPSAPGYWPERQDAPTWPWPMTDGLPDRGGMSVVSASVEFKAPSLHDLLAAAEEGDWLSPASAADQLETVLLGPDPLLAAEAPDGELRLTRSGADVLDDAWARLQERSAQQQLAAMHAAVDDVAAGTQSVEAVLGAHGLKQGGAVAAYIDEAAKLWAGSSREAVLASVAAQPPVPPRVNLPPGLDPERWLPSDHPFRALRVEMEATLATREDWVVLTPLQQAAARVEALAASADPQVAALFRSELWWLNPVALWLAGATEENARQMIRRGPAANSRGVANLRPHS